MQKKTALAATALLLGAQFALVQNSRGHGDVQPQTVDTEGLEPLPEEIQYETPTVSRAADSSSPVHPRVI